MDNVLLPFGSGILLAVIIISLVSATNLYNINDGPDEVERVSLLSSNQFISDSYPIRMDVSPIPEDCLVLCAQFLFRKRDFDNFQLVSRQFYHICNYHLQSQHYFWLFNRSNTFKCWDDVRKRIKMTPMLYLHLHHHQPYLIGMHRTHQLTFIRGLDFVSKQPFISIKLMNRMDVAEQVLLLCTMNYSRITDAFICDVETQWWYSLQTCSLGVDPIDQVLRALHDRPLLLQIGGENKTWITSEIHYLDLLCSRMFSVHVSCMVFAGLLVTGLGVLLQYITSHQND